MEPSPRADSVVAASPVSSSSRVRLRLIPVEGPAERFDARASCA